MKAEKRENIIYILFILIVLVMAVVYFSAPERKLFLENQIKWWKEFWSNRLKFPGKNIVVIIPVLNEEKTLPLVLNDIPKDIVNEVVVVDNGSTDRTSEIAKRRAQHYCLNQKRDTDIRALEGLNILKKRTRISWSC